MHTLFWLSIAALSTASFALHRTIGDPNDPSLQNLTTECLQTTPGAGFTYGKCPYLVRCMLDGLHSEISAGMQSGSNIVSLVPTTLALIGVSPIEIIQLAFASPLQGLVMCVFGIGLPNNLFRQFSSFTDHSTRHQDAPASEELRVRQWTIPVPARQWQGVIKAKAVFIDLIFLVLLGVMVWQTVSLNYSSVISWRCDYSFLLICWPVACVFWLIIAMTGLFTLAQKIRIRYREHDQEEWSEVSWSALVRHRYNLLGRFNGENDTTSSTFLVMENLQDVGGRGKLPQSRYGAYYSVEITMRYDWAWQYYEAATEALAVGIYLYATFVLTSSLFVSGSTGIVYMTVMVCCLGAIRVLIAL